MTMVDINRTRRDRAKLYGSDMTPRERLKHLSRTRALTFKHRVTFEDPFTSVTGATRSKTALVFLDGKGAELLLTEAEAQQLKELGVAIPPEAFKSGKKAPEKRGLGGLL